MTCHIFLSFSYPYRWLKLSFFLAVCLSMSKNSLNYENSFYWFTKIIMYNLPSRKIIFHQLIEIFKTIIASGKKSNNFYWDSGSDSLIYTGLMKGILPKDSGLIMEFGFSTTSFFYFLRSTSYFKIYSVRYQFIEMSSSRTTLSHCVDWAAIS